MTKIYIPEHLYGKVDYSSLARVRDTLKRVLQTSQNEAEKNGRGESLWNLLWVILKSVKKNTKI